MIQLEKMTFESFLLRINEMLVDSEESHIFSWTEKIEPFAPIALFQRAEETGKDRIFWMNSTHDFSIVGIGATEKIIAEKDRYTTLQRKWSDVIRSATVFDPYKKEGTGLIALGGMTFDPLHEESGVWESFPTSQLTVPTYSFVQHHDNYYVTVTQKVTSSIDVQQVLSEFASYKQFVHATYTDSDYHTVLSKEEEDCPGWLQSVEEAITEIKQGRAGKIVLARLLRAHLSDKADLSGMLARLKKTQPTSYLFAVEHGDDCFIGATPERLIQVKGDDVLSTCLAGTAPRGKTATEDEKIADDLFNDEKNREEHEHVVQMIRRAIEPFCMNIDIPDEPTVYRLRNLHHLYTPVRATLKEKGSLFAMIEALHPTPALGGVPRDYALEFIREHESVNRGWYGAPIGWVDHSGNSEFAVAIRSGLVRKDEALLFAGCGVMRDSDPQLELEETGIKFLPMLNVLEDKG